MDEVKVGAGAHAVRRMRTECEWRVEETAGGRVAAGTRGRRHRSEATGALCRRRAVLRDWSAAGSISPARQARASLRGGYGRRGERARASHERSAAMKVSLARNAQARQ